MSAAIITILIFITAYVVAVVIANINKYFMNKSTSKRSVKILQYIDNFFFEKDA